jgi:hypothetical protein
MFKFNAEGIIQHYKSDYDEIRGIIVNNEGKDILDNLEIEVNIRDIFDTLIDTTNNTPENSKTKINIINKQMINIFKLYEKNINNGNVVRETVSKNVSKRMSHIYNFFNNTKKNKQTNKPIVSKKHRIERKPSISNALFGNFMQHILNNPAQNQNASMTESRFVKKKYITYLDKIEQLGVIQPPNYLLSPSKKNPNTTTQKYILWLLRNVLFHYVLIYTTIYFPNSRELDNVSLYAVGSKNYTSDIDVSVLNTGNEKHLVSELIYYIETTFVDLYGINSLYFDIEFYSNYLMMSPPPINIDFGGVGGTKKYRHKKQSMRRRRRPLTVLSMGGENNNNEYYYIDTSTFNYDDFKDVSKYAIASVMRNLSFGFKNYDMIIDDVKPYLNKIIHFFSDLNKNGIMLSQQNVGLNFLLDDNELLDVKTMVDEYLTLTNYIIAITKYKEKLQTFENEYFELKKQTTPFSKEQMVEIFKLYCVPNIFREESYICPSTVLFIVKYIQDERKKMNEISDTTETELCRMEKTKWANCNIGFYGNLLGIIEQFGYIFRFAETYKDDQEHKEKKIKKYGKRIAEGLCQMIDTPNMMNTVLAFLNSNNVNEQYLFGVQIN